MLDPPAFTKNRETIQKAIAGYKEINLRGMKLVRPGGFLVTSSCTNLVNEEMFLHTIDIAAKDAKRKLKTGFISKTIWRSSHNNEEWIIHIILNS